MAYNSSAPREEDVKIFVDNAMVWNLIESGHEYFASYEGSAAKGFHLAQINHPGDQDTLR
ncbi:hypothetical protein GZH47_31020 [Paenibacillus rhizovicinus]|uniref:Uncharacterized protein n=1 Tax=Paenibacillus rhizovicinus TaxID=2704463 RepID=A0A6C0P8T4_9BACL|nr:hypothetical protein [Paenibacillus rhizovicinus]QHW34795.1 hypothetical protein GZH47_31020 [Paenibacillus rhizovicinus]